MKSSSLLQTPFRPTPARHADKPPVRRSTAAAVPKPILDNVDKPVITPPPPRQGPELRVDGQYLQRCDIADLRPGDIGFTYQRAKYTRRQRLIHLGERVINIVRPSRRGSPHVLHAFIVVDTHPASRKLLVADAAVGASKDDITLLVMDFKEQQAVRPMAKYLFYRTQDTALAKRIASVARNWTHTAGVKNFSASKAITSTFHPATLRKSAGDRALYFASQADHKGPLRKPESRIAYHMMCSEFVANVCIAATLAQWQQAKRAQGRKADMSLTGLWNGPAGNTFAVDGKGTPPSVLHARVAHSDTITTVGYVPGTEASTSAVKSRLRMPAWPGFGRSNTDLAQ